MDKKKLTMLIVGGVLALVVLSILIVGIFEGIWPWDGPKAYAKIFRPDPTTPAVTESTTPQPAGEETESPTTGSVPGNQGTNVPAPTTGNPVIDGESTTGTGKVEEEVVVGGNTGSTGSEDGSTGSEDGSTGENSGSTGDTSDADATISGSSVPGWGN